MPSPRILAPLRRWSSRLLVYTSAVFAGLFVLNTAAQAARQTEEQLSSTGRYFFRYLLYLPPAYATPPTQRWPLMVMLHGSGAVGMPMNVMSLAGPGLRIEQGYDFPAVVVSPQNSNYNWSPTELAAFIDDVADLYRIDRDRIYITGMSMGGYGTWNLATAFPDRYAAIVPVCGGGSVSLAARLRDVPVWAFHGAVDRTVPVVRSQEMIDAIRAAGGSPQLTIYPQTGHDSWVQAYADESMYAWMFAQDRARGPAIIRQPVAAAAFAGESARFSVEATGTDLRYQWRKDGALLPATTSTLNLPAVSAGDEGEYSVAVMNARGFTVSTATTLTVRAAPQILRSPTDQIAAPHQPALFHVTAAGGDLAYRWMHDGVEIAGANEPLLSIAAGEAGNYSVTVSNPRGEATSSPARLRVATADDHARVVNLSVRAAAGTNDNTLIVGLTVGGASGSAGLPVLLRGVGPGLSALGVDGVLQDPAITIFDRTTVLGRNGDWRPEPLLIATTDRLGAFPLSDHSRDAAALLVLPAGGYTMHVNSSLGEPEGVALLECYDASGRGTSIGPRLTNLSVRARASGGDGALIAGFVIAGTGTRTILIRGLGPALASSGVTGWLHDPQLRLFRGGTVIDSNDDWAGAAALRDAFGRVGAPSLPADAKDAALLVTLAAGTYSAHVNAPDNAAGAAMIELFVMP